MEKKITKKFYLLSASNLITIVVLGQGFTLNTLALFIVLVILVVNHATLVKMIVAISQSMTLTNAEAKRALRKALFLICFKMTLIALIFAGIYFYDITLIAKVMVLMIFQLIIQVVSIKNNY